MFGIGRFEELLVILAIVLLLFGGKKLPELSRGLGDSIREIRKGFLDKDKTTAHDKTTTDHKDADA